MPVLIQIPENPNCDPVDGLVFQCRTQARRVTQVLWEDGEWCSVAGIAEGGTEIPAMACLVEDSGDGMCYLVVGGDWGLRLQAPDAQRSWGVTYLLLGGDGQDLRFAE